MFWNTKIKCGIFLLLLALIAMYFHQLPLTNELIVALELNPSEEGIKILTTPFGIDEFKRVFTIHVCYDFLLMLSYVYLLFNWIKFLQSSSNNKLWNLMGNISCYLIFLAGLLDITEDFLMYQYLVQDHKIFLWNYVSTIKFLLIFIVVIYVLSYLYIINKKAPEKSSAL